jgi:hypothetical protein
MSTIDTAAEVARIKAELAARDGAWEAAIKARLHKGPATSRDLADAAGISTTRELGWFKGCLIKCGGIVRAGEQIGRHGQRNTVWKLVPEGIGSLK